MAVRIQVPRKAKLVRAVLSPWGRGLLLAFIVLNTVGLLAFTWYYNKYSRLVEEKLSSGPFANTSMVFAGPQVVMVGDQTTSNEIVDYLRDAGYGPKVNNRMGWYNLRPDGIEIYPGPDSYFDQEEGVIKISKGKVTQIIALRDNTERTQYLLEPQLITNLFDRNREKRRIVEFSDIRPVLVNAIIATEDKRFFKHSGFDPLRILKAAYVDIKQGRNAEGASTLSMQVARGFWLTPEKTWKRKLAETMITLHLEQRLSKKEIFAYYANHIDLGRRGSFAIRGVGEAAQAYFGKDFRDLSLAEAATIAGLIQRPSYTNPVRWPERAKARRNVVLQLMLENGYIDEREYAAAAASPLVIARAGTESTDAPYFVDLVNDWLQDEFADHDFQTNSYRVYTTLDLNLQRDATEAVRLGLAEVEKLMARRRARDPKLPPVQAALVAVDAQTGEIRALIGGRDYGESQLNRALAKRQPGSVFKPFVYAAALNTAVAGGNQILTPASTILDEPTTFYYDGRPYQPSNFHDQWHGTVTMRTGLTKSLNIPTVKLAEMTGYRAVVDIARRAGLNMDIRATPAVALGAYEVTPIEIAGAYTMFPNRGVTAMPHWVRMIRAANGQAIFDAQPQHRPVLDPRVNYLMISMMEDVLRTGTGAAVRSRGFTLPAAGKTGTSHDGWFAGFTSRLVCVIWVGFDDNRELGLEGAKSALPIWTEFMKRAHQHRQYRNVREFDAPDGIVSVDIDPATGQLATASCPNARAEYFVSGTQPIELCRLHGGGGTQVAGWETAPAKPVSSPVPGSIAPADGPVRAARATPPVTSIEAGAGQQPAPVNGNQKAEPKKGFWGRMKDIFR
ncbi:MAG TPA: PBP1A family penicillin-binding protein [Bryobacteraceae bacterium]|nr:PBP1A family penicillin-binding protein [Bryobacteraceae bacterium]